MIVMNARAHLPSLGISAGFRLALPNSACRGGERLRYILCLHGYGQTGEDLLHALPCAAAVDAAGTALLFPDGQNSCFLNMAHGPAWETYLLEGLMPFALRSFPLQAKPALFGAGTGGWAAARLAAAYPQQFAASLALDAEDDLPARYAAGSLTGREDLEAVFGNPGAMPAYALSGDTRRVRDMPAMAALQLLLTDDWSTHA